MPLTSTVPVRLVNLVSQNEYAPEYTDECLMSRVCEGDKDALAVLFRRYARVVRGVALRVLRDPSEADDLLQDIFLLINRLCGTFDSSKAPARFWIHNAA